MKPLTQPFELFWICLQFPSRESGVRISIEITTCLCLYPHLIPYTEVEHCCVTGRLIPWTSTFSRVRHERPLTVPVYIGITVITVSTTHGTPCKDVQTLLWTGKCPRLLAVSLTHVCDYLVVYYLLVCPLWAAATHGNCERYISHPLCNTVLYNVIL